MKYKTTKKEMKENYWNILSVGYCELQYLLRSTSPESYISGVYGWSCDNYNLKGTKRTLLLSTGYNPISDKNINKNVLKNKYNIIKKYEEKAKKINHTSGYTWSQIEKKLNKLVIKFVDEIMEVE